MNQTACAAARVYYVLQMLLGGIVEGSYVSTLAPRLRFSDKLDGAQKFESIQDLVRQLSRGVHPGAEAMGLGLTLNYQIARVEEIPGSCTPAREERIVFAESELSCDECGSPGVDVKWAVACDGVNTRRVFFMKSRSEYGPLNSARLFDSIEEASTALFDWSRNAPWLWADAHRLRVVPVAVEQIPAVTEKSTFKITVVS